jgi:hypothetical protein
MYIKKKNLGCRIFFFMENPFCSSRNSYISNFLEE